MTARELEANGIVTVVIGSAMDVVTRCKVPRYLHNDLPLGNPLGKPYDTTAQRQSVAQALALCHEATQPVVQVSTLKWSDDETWKESYGRIDETNRAMLLAMGEENRRRRAQDKAKGLFRRGSAA